METEFKSIVKYNIATAAVLAATFIAIVGAVIDSPDVRTDHRAAQSLVQPMETITVTAPRAEVARLDTMLVAVSRDARTLIALK